MSRRVVIYVVLIQWLCLDRKIIQKWFLKIYGVNMFIRFI